MQSLAPVAAQFGVAVSVVEPAVVETNMADNADRNRLFIDLDGQYGPLAEKFLRFVTDGFADPQSPWDAAAVVADAATTDAPKFRWQTSDAAVAWAELSLSDLEGSNVLDAMSKILR